MEWNDLESEIKRFQEMNPEDVKNIINTGINTEFWKWLRADIAGRMRIAEYELRHSSAKTFDHLIELGKFNALYQLMYMFLNLPDLYLKNSEVKQNFEMKKKNMEALKNVLNAR